MRFLHFFTIMFSLLIIISGCAATQMPKGQGVICDSCKGLGEKFVCPTCMGSGEMSIADGQEWVSCSTCSGDGIIEGYWRRKYIIGGPKEEYIEARKCSDCKGIGSVYQIKYKQVTCSTCQGTGKGHTHLICKRCKGTGHVAKNSIWMINGWSEAE
jgi:DnaJ-class molecular chaperone